MAGVWKGLWLALQDKDEKEAERERLKLSREQFDQTISLKREEMDLERQKFMADLVQLRSASIDEVQKRREALMQEAESKAEKIILAKSFGLTEQVAVALERSGRLDSTIDTLEKRIANGDLSPAAVKGINISVGQYLKDLPEEELANYTVSALLTPGNLTSPEGMSAALGTALSYKNDVLPLVESVRQAPNFDISALTLKSPNESEYGRIVSDVAKALAPTFGAPITTVVNSNGETSFIIDPDYQDSASLNNLVMQVARRVSEGVSVEGRPYNEAFTDAFNNITELKNQNIPLNDMIVQYGGIGRTQLSPETTPNFLKPVEVETPEDALDFLSNPTTQPLGEPTMPQIDIFEELRGEGYR